MTDDTAWGWARRSRLPLLERTPVALVTGCLLALALTLPQALDVWRTGAFHNPDDAMRTVQLRDFMAGQEWFDLVPHRLSPDHPFAMHWSRLVDAPLAALVWIFGVFVPIATAELWMRLIEPILLYVVALWAVVRIAAALIGRRAMIPAALLLGGSTEFVSNFIPGHIHHHGVQATLLLLATWALLRAVIRTSVCDVASGVPSPLAEEGGAQRRMRGHATLDAFAQFRKRQSLSSKSTVSRRAGRLHCHADRLPVIASEACRSIVPALRGLPRRLRRLAMTGRVAVRHLRVKGDSTHHKGKGVALSAILAVLSLGIGLQNLPFVIGLAAIAGLFWVMRGEACAIELRAFGLGLAGTAVPVFLLDVPPGSYGEGACDAYSAAHLVALIATGTLFAILAQSTSRMPGFAHRLGALAFAAAAVVGLVATTFPACLHDPMASVDPVLRSVWLADVGEALPLIRLIALAPGAGFVLLLTLFVGLAATAFAALHSEAAARPGWWALGLLAGIGFCGTLWQVRVAASTCAFLVPGLAATVLALFDRLSRHPNAPALLLATIAGLVGNGAGLSALATSLPPGTSGHAAAGQGSLQSCFAPESYAALAALPPGLVLSTIDPGSAILAYTGHSVLAAPYHRNTYGNRASILALAAPADEALPIVAEARARYLVLCRSSNEVQDIVRLHPDSFTADLMAGRQVRWLTPLDEGRAPLLLFRVDADQAVTTSP